MNLTRFNIQSCCGGTAIIYKIDRPLTKDHVSSLVSLGFMESSNFAQAGILYVSNSDFIMNGPLGSNRLTVRCKKKEQECVQKLNDLEDLLRKVE